MLWALLCPFRRLFCRPTKTLDPLDSFALNTEDADERNMVKEEKASGPLKREATSSPANSTSHKKNRKKKKQDDDSIHDGPVRDETGLFKEGSLIYCKNSLDNTWRPSRVIVAQRDQDNKPKYYVHFIELNRRMDDWIADENARSEHPDGKQAHKDVVEFVEEDYGESQGMDAEAIKEHELVTKVKNVSKVELGRNIIHTWYFSPIPKEFYPNGSIDTLYMSEFTLEMFHTSSELARHYSRTEVWHPPGDEIYRDEEARISFWEVDGNKSRFYAQNLCYLAKMFLDHKALFYDVTPFLFYVLCEFDEQGYHLVGYFSKEKHSDSGFNLACILTLPPYQRRGMGNLLISFSYELSKKEGKVGSPEKPLSDLGQISYRHYWSVTVLETLLEMEAESMSIMEITAKTSIKTEDVVLALKFLGLIKQVRDGPHVQYVLCVDKELIKKKLGTFKQKGPKVDAAKLHWAPLKIDVKKDKWEIKAKLKGEHKDKSS